MNYLLLVLCLIWGFNFVIMKQANSLFSPVMFAALRFLVGSIVLFGLSVVVKVPKVDKQKIKWFILVGIFQTAYFNLAIQVSLKYLNAGLVSVLTYSMPLFFSILAHFFIPGEKLTPIKLGGIMMGLAGLGLALNITGFVGDFTYVILGLSSAVSWAIANLIIKTKLHDCNKIQFTSWQMVIGTLVLFGYAYGFETVKVTFSYEALGYLLFSGVVASAFAFVLWSNILTKISASKASTALLLVPVVGLGSSYFFLHETLGLVSILGVGLILAGIKLVNN